MRVFWIVLQLVIGLWCTANFARDIYMILNGYGAAGVWFALVWDGVFGFLNLYFVVGSLSAKGQS